MGQCPQPDIGDGPDAEHHAGHQDGHEDHHKQKAGAAPGMVPGLDADVLHRQRQPRLIAENRLVLRPVVLKHPVDVLLLGAEDQVQQEDQNLQRALHQVPAPHGEAREEVEDAAGHKGGQHQEQQDGEPHAQNHGEGHDGPLQLFAGELGIQPLFEFGGLRNLFLRVEVGGVHQGLHTVDHGGQEVDRAPDQGPAQDGVPVLDEPQLLHLFHQFAVLVPDHDGLLFRAPHQDAFDQRLSADASAEGAGLVFFCHGNSFLRLVTSQSYHDPQENANICSISCGNHSFMGRQMVTTAPPPSALPMVKMPLWRPMISSHTARPMPLPRALEDPL